MWCDREQEQSLSSFDNGSTHSSDIAVRILLIRWEDKVPLLPERIARPVNQSRCLLSQRFTVASSNNCTRGEYNYTITQVLF